MLLKKNEKNVITVIMLCYKCITKKYLIVG